MPASRTHLGATWDAPPTDSTTPADTLAQTLKLPPLVARLLAARGHATPQAASEFIRPTLQGLHDPTLLPGCNRAAQRILHALEHTEKITIYGDYDVDGITATAILYHTINHIRPDADCHTYVPHRIDEGYGINADAINQLADDGTQLIISVDCGITAHDPARTARERGTDLIITDHHNPDRPDPDAPPRLPSAHTIVHPAIPDEHGDTYPWPELCGAGVAFKLAWRLCTLASGGESRVDPATRELLLDLLALAALGTVADVVPLADENRLITRFGLAKLKNTSIHGIDALLEAANLAGHNVSAEDAGFKLAPRLNACGRMGHAKDAVELLTTATPHRARQIAEQLNALNTTRQNTERTIARQATKLAEKAGMTDPATRAIILAHEDWHPGVIGIVCSRLVDTFRKPVLLMQHADAVCKGSARSIDGFSIHDALHHCADHLATFGGHDMAAGLSLAADNLDAFTNAFIEHAAAHITDDMTRRRLRIDTHATINEINVHATEHIQSLGPFGRSNPKPNILIRNARLAQHAETMGKNASHLALRLQPHDATPATPTLRAVAWSMGDAAPTLRAGQRIDIVARPTLNRWQGRTSAELEIIDFRPASHPHTDAEPQPQPSGETSTFAIAP